MCTGLCSQGSPQPACHRQQHLFGGCHLSRDTAAAIARAGFTITSLEEFLFPAARSPVSFHVAGHATAPAP